MKRSLLEGSNEDSVKWRRSYKACLHCRTRKVKCDMGPLDNPHEPPCVRCKRERRKCIFPETKKRGGIRSDSDEYRQVSEIESQKSVIKNAIRDKQSILSGYGAPRVDFVDTKWKFEINSMQNALEFLAKAAGSVAREEDPDLVDATQKYNQLASIETSEKNTKRLPIAEKDAENHIVPSLDTSDESYIAPLVRTTGSQRAAIPLIEKLSNIRPKSSKKLTDIEYIGPSKMLSEDEAIKLIEVFFLKMHPFFPHIPLQLQDPQELARYPILMCAIITIAARYHSFDGIGLFDSENCDRNIEIHERLWAYCQRLISQTIWAEASTRSIGTVLAFLLFTEWNPRAIHWRWSDYANNLDLNDISKRDTRGAGFSKESDGLTGMGAIRRSDRMAWMLTGNAVRLAQDMGFMDNSCKIFIATHIAETHTAMNVNQRSTLAESLNEISLGSSKNRRNLVENTNHIGNENFYLEQIFQNDDSKERWTNFLQNMNSGGSGSREAPFTDIEREFLNDEYVLYYATANDDSSQRQFPSSLPFPLKFSISQRAKIELLRIISIGYEAIYSGKDKQQTLLNDPRRNLALLHIVSPLIESWHKSYQELLKPATGEPCSLEICRNRRAVHELSRRIDGESLICDYYYCQLYIYSLALQVDVKESQLKLSEITRSAKYVELAYSAAKEILNSAARLHKLKMLKCMPVRWVTRIVRSVAFIVKCYLTLTGNGLVNNPVANTILKLTVIPAEETLQTIQNAAITLKEASPDELHLCMRYSTILMYLCSEMKLRNRANNKGEERVLFDCSQPMNGSNGEEEDPYDTMSPFTTQNNGQEERNKYDGRQVLEERSQEQVDAKANPSSGIGQSLPDEVIDWFSNSDDIGLEFVESWTEMIEQRYLQSGDVGGQTFENLYNQVSINASDSPSNPREAENN